MMCKNEEDPIKKKRYSANKLIVRFFRCSRAANSEVSGVILPKFELIQALIVVLVICKNEKDPIKNKGSTSAFTYYYDPVILRNKLTPLSIFRDLALKKRDSKKFMFYFYVFYGVYTNIQNEMGWYFIHSWIFWAMALHVSVLEQISAKF